MCIYVYVKSKLKRGFLYDKHVGDDDTSLDIRYLSNKCAKGGVSGKYVTLRAINFDIWGRRLTGNNHCQEQK